MQTASITLEDSFQVGALPEVVWPLLIDPDVVVTCIPGAAITAVRDGGSLEGVMRVKLGPTVVEFHGQVRPTFDDGTRTGVLEAKGSDRHGRTKAHATLTFAVTPGAEGYTLLTMGGEIVANGGLAPFVRTGGAHLARRMMADFGVNLTRRVMAADEPSGDAPAEAPSVGEVAPVSGFRLLRRTFAEAIRSLVGRLRRREPQDTTTRRRTR